MRRNVSRKQRICYVDESIQASCGVVVTAFVFVDESLDQKVRDALEESGYDPETVEFKSGARMAGNSGMQEVRERIIDIASRHTKIAVFFGPFSRKRLGRQTLQALQSVIVRNGFDPDGLRVHFDQEIFSSRAKAEELLKSFKPISKCIVYGSEDSLSCRGIQVADAVAHSFGQVVKAEISEEEKMVDIGGPNTGYEQGTMAPLSWALLMRLRYAMLSRRVALDGSDYDPTTDPVILAPYSDDQIEVGQNPVLLGWGVQVAPEADAILRDAVQRRLDRIWLGCIH